MSSLRILMIASEAVPFAKTGGLADVAGALPRALACLGHQVSIALPRYRGVAAGRLVTRFPITLKGVVHEAGIYEEELAAGVRAVLVDCPAYYDRAGLYGIGNEDYPDNASRFAFLCRAALEHAARAGSRPDVVHAHDWQAGLAPVHLRTLYADHPVLAGTPSVFTIHNLAYQGLFPADVLPALDLPWDLFTIEGLEYWGRVSFLKAGINFSRIVTTVSPTYAREIQTPQFGFGFDGILRRRADHLLGILNGIDAERWDPASDPCIECHYDLLHLDGKRGARRELLAAVGLPEPGGDRPVIGLISRLVEQKGFDLLAEAADVLPTLGATFVLLGSGERRYERCWLDLSARYPTRFAVRIGFDEKLAHQIEAGSDMFLMPSRFEPCGLNQMYSLRYGTVPIVRATGGLDDTVENYDPTTGAGTGFKFRDYTEAALLGALRAAISTYGQPSRWRGIQEAGMQLDYSWTASAREYVKAYDRAIAEGRSSAPRNTSA